MIYINKFAVQSSVVTFVFFTSYSLGNIGSVKANELRSSSTSQNISNVERTLQKIENDILVEPSTLEHEKISQNVTSVSQLSDVKPNDWAFTSLQSLVERYGCIAGYSDRTFLGKQALSRYEFAAGLNACLDKINEIISAGLADKVSKDDLASLKKLQEEFASELVTLRGRVDTVDAKVAKVESQKFSTTTKLNASIIFTIADTWGGFGTGTALQNPQPTKDASNTTFSYRARLNFDTSFTGKDLLRLRLQAGNNPNLGSNNPATSPTNTNMARLSSASNTDNFFQMDKFYYRFRIGNRATAYVGLVKLDPDDIADTLNPNFEGSEKGALSRFGRYDPLVFRGPSGAGIGFSYKILPEFAIAASYLANSDTSSNATGQAGLFSGGYIANLQIVYAPN
ncbi:MAG: iron uptake porin, partial [Pseudanabaena sp. ELA607]